MTAREPRFEIVRSDAGWHARFRAANGRIVFTSEVYTRRRAAVCAVKVMIDPLLGVGIEPHWDHRTRSMSDAVVYRRDAWNEQNGCLLEIREVDERTAVTS